MSQEPTTGTQCHNLPSKSFFALDALDEHEITNQRQLSKMAGISLGHANHVLKVFLQKGLVKIENTYHHPDKKKVVYLLTKKGQELKSRLAARFMVSQLKEYSRFKNKIKEKLILIERKGYSNIILVGPKIVKDFVDKVIKENAMDLDIVGCCKDLKGLEAHSVKQYELALLANGDSSNIGVTPESFNPFQGKLLPLW